MSKSTPNLLEELKTTYGFTEDYLESIPDGITIFNNAGKLLLVNTAFCEISGFNKNDIVGLKSPFPFWPSNELAEYKKRFKKILKENLNGEFQSIHKRKNGEQYPVSIFFASILNIQEEVIAHIAVIQDISGIEEQAASNPQNKEIFSVLNYRKKYLDLLSKKRVVSKFENSINKISDGFISLDKNWCYTYVNIKAGEIIGRPPNSLIGKNIWTEYPEGIGLPFYKIYHKAVKTKEVQIFEEYYEPINKWYENRVYPTSEGLTIYFTDITEKKITENNNQKLLSLIETSEDFIGLASLDGVPLYLNANGRKLVSLGARKKLPLSIKDFFKKDYHKVIENEHMPNIFKKNRWNGEAAFKNFKTGHIIPIEMSGFLIKDSKDKEPLALGIVAKDITKRKEAEDKLIKNELLFRGMASNAPVGIFKSDAKGSCIYVNENWINSSGLSFEESLGFGWTKAIHPEDKDRINKGWQNAITNQIDYVTDLRFIKKNKEVLWLEAKSVALFDEDNVFYGYIGMLIDITERKIAEKKLIESEQLFKRLTSQAPAGIFQTDINGSCNYVNDSWSKCADLTFEEAMGNGWAATIHKDDYERILNEWNQYVLSDDIELKTEFRFRRKDNSITWVSVKTVGTFDSQNNLYGYIGMTIDITDHKVAEEKRRKSDQLFRGLAANAPVGIFQTDETGACNYVNEEWMKYSGFSFEEALGFGWSNALHPEDKDKVLQEWDKSIETKSEFNLDCRFLQKNGKVTWISAKTVGLFDTNNELYGYIGTLVDITERKQTEDKLINSELLFRGLTANAPVGIFQTDVSGNCNFVNQEWVKYSGVSFKEAKGKGWIKSLHPDDKNSVVKKWEEYILARNEYKIDLRFVNKKSNKTTWLSVKAEGLYDVNNKLYGHIGICIDITERKDAEEKLLNSELLFRELSSNAPVGIFKMDLDGSCNYVNEQWVKYAEIPFKKALGFGWTKAIHPEDRERVVGTWMEIVSTGKEFNSDFRFLNNEGKVTWISVRAVGNFNSKNQLYGYVGMCLDITQRKAAEKKLISSELLFRELTSTAPVAIVRTTKDGKCSFVNEEFLKYTGLTFKESLGLNWVNAVHPNDKDKVIEEWLDAVNNENDFISEFRFVNKKGEITWVSVKVVGLFDDVNKLYGYTGTCLDITERRNSIEKIKKSERYLENIINNIGDPVFVKNSKSELILVNDSFCKILDLKRKDIIGQTLAKSMPKPERERFLYNDKQVLLTGKENTTIETFKLNRKDIKTISTKKTRFINNSGDKFIIGVIRDITKRKKVEEEIRMFNQRLTTHLNNSPLAVVEWDKDFFVSSWSAQAEKIFGWKESEALGKQLADLNLVFEEDIPKTNIIAEELRTGKVKSNRIINRNNTKAGKVIYCEWYNSVLQSPTGELETVLSLIQDVTERVKFEENLKESEEKFSKVFQSNLIGLSIVNKDEIRIEVNDTLAKILETTREHLIGKTFEEAKVDILDAAYYEQKKWLAQKILVEGYVNNETITRTLVSGKKISLLTSVEAIEIAGETHALFAVVDITDKKKAELELEIHRNNLEELVDIRTSELEKEKVKAQSADLMKSAFLATMSHELRTPMNSIMGFTGILLKELAGPLNTEQKKQLSMVKNSSSHLLGLINDILDISKIEAGKLKVSFYSFNYLEVLEKTVEFLMPQAKEKGLEINTQISKLNITLVSDERRVEQILINLLSNAIKFSNKGVINIKVDVIKNKLITKVIDQGIGIGEKDISKLFVPFVQVENGLSRKHEGTGLGLAICKSLTEKLGGVIFVESKLGKGSVFTLELPLDFSAKSSNSKKKLN